MNEIEMIRRIQAIIEKIGKVTTEKLPFCSKTMYWQVNKLYAKSTEKNVLNKMINQHFGEVTKVEHGHYCVQPLGGEIIVVYGNFAITDEENTSGFYAFPYEVTAMMKNGIVERLILNGSRDEPAICMVKSDEDHFYMLKESEVLYIEASHNNAIWHCRDLEVTSRGTLKELEKRLPNYFYRLQRGYIVNAYHIRSLAEKEVTIDNGDILIIPSRNYYKVKKQLRKFCEEMVEIPEGFKHWNWLNLC